MPLTEKQAGVLKGMLIAALVAATAHLVWAASMPVAYLGVVPAAVGMFVVGGIAFFAGYRRGAPARAFGFALTFYPSILVLLALVVHAVARALGA